MTTPLPPAVLFLDQSGELGGAELSLLDIVTRRQGRTEVCLMSDGPFARRLEQGKVAVSLWGDGAALTVRRGDGMGAVFRAVPALAATVRSVARRARQFDVIHANTLKAFVVAAVSKPWHRRPVIWHLRDLLTPEHFSATLRRSTVRLARLSGAHVIANSQATADAFISLGGRADAAVVYNGIDAAPFDAVDAVAARQRLVDETGLNGDLPIVGVFSRLAAWKGQHVLVEALAGVPELQAVIVGGPLFGEQAYETRLRAQIAQLGLDHRIRLLGFRADIPALMSAVDIVAHTSTSAEPFGRVIVEGMLAGKPVIATRAGGATELISDGETGRLVTPGDKDDLARALKAVARDPEASRAMSLRANQHARSHFHVDDYVRQVEAVISRVARAAKARG